MKPFFNVSVFSTASWSNPNLWESVFDSLNADLSLKIRSLNRCRRGESSRRLIQSNQEAATLVSELKQGSTELMTDHSYCLVAFGKGISVEVYFPSITQVLDKREYSYDSFRLMISCETAMRPPMSRHSWPPLPPRRRRLRPPRARRPRSPSRPRPPGSRASITTAPCCIPSATV